MKQGVFSIICLLFFSALPLCGQQAFTLNDCLHYAISHNEALQKDRLSLEEANLSRKEVVGSMLPQINATGAFTYNIDKTTVAMPNFIGEAMHDPDAPKYLTVTMGMDLSANWGGSIAQQVMNFSVFNAITITKKSIEMAQLGVGMTTQDIIAQTATLFYNIQVLEYAISEFEVSIGYMDRTIDILSVNGDNGLVRDVDVNRVKVKKTNLSTEKDALEIALDVQKRLLKLQMGFPMNDSIEVIPPDFNELESEVYSASAIMFDIERLVPWKMLMTQQNMTKLQYKSAVYANLPVITFVANYSMNYMGDDFVGETYHHFPMSMLSLNMKLPIFTGLSNTNKVKKARVEMMKAEQDEVRLRQALSMSFTNSTVELEQQLKTVASQKDNVAMAEDVLQVTESNFREGISSLSDVLDASTALVQSQMNYANAMNKCLTAYIDLKKSNGTIEELVK